MSKEEQGASQHKETPEELTKRQYDEHVIGVKQLRQALDRTLQSMKNVPPSTEVLNSITKIQEGIMWLGMELKRLGEANPYPNSYDPTNTKIEKTADNLKL